MRRALGTLAVVLVAACSGGGETTELDVAVCPVEDCDPQSSTSTTTPPPSTQPTTTTTTPPLATVQAMTTEQLLAAWSEPASAVWVYAVTSDLDFHSEHVTIDEDGNVVAGADGAPETDVVDAEREEKSTRHVTVTSDGERTAFATTIPDSGAVEFDRSERLLTDGVRTEVRSDTEENELLCTWRPAISLLPATDGALTVETDTRCDADDTPKGIDYQIRVRAVGTETVDDTPLGVVNTLLVETTRTTTGQRATSVEVDLDWVEPFSGVVVRTVETYDIEGGGLEIHNQYASRLVTIL